MDVISKHLMLKFISNLACHGAFFVQISKHLMLKFIFRPLHSGHALRWISKHLMLKFIPVSVTLACLFSSFQNILCWSLSPDLLFRFNWYLHFKTSYVEVYRLQHLWSGLCWRISKHLMLKFIRGRNPVGIFFHKFQNILCWSLSLTFGKCMIRCLHFKTSYVEVYPTGRSGCWIRFRISKHLMLKFIISGSRRRRGVVIISKHLMLKFIISGSRRRRGVVIISKHLMLKFILLMPWRYIRQHSISKHLMLKFIDLDFRSDQFDFDFKTSYVEVYL